MTFESKEVLLLLLLCTTHTILRPAACMRLHAPAACAPPWRRLVVVAMATRSSFQHFHITSPLLSSFLFIY
jgi:hypothetical protein